MPCFCNFPIQSKGMSETPSNLPSGGSYTLNSDDDAYLYKFFKNIKRRYTKHMWEKYMYNEIIFIVCFYNIFYINYSHDQKCSDVCGHPVL